MSFLKQQNKNPKGKQIHSPPFDILKSSDMKTTRECGSKKRIRIVLGIKGYSGNIKSSGLCHEDGPKADRGEECIRLRSPMASIHEKRLL